MAICGHTIGVWIQIERDQILLAAGVSKVMQNDCTTHCECYRSYLMEATLLHYCLMNGIEGLAYMECERILWCWRRFRRYVRCGRNGIDRVRRCRNYGDDSLGWCHWL